MWEMASSIAKGSGLGDIGTTVDDEPQVQLRTDCSEPYALMGFLELERKTGRKAFLDIARRIGDNILTDRSHKGFFVPSRKHIYARLDAIESLVLLHLDRSVNSRTMQVPQILPAWLQFQSEYRGRGDVTDTQTIYTLTESTEPPIALNEAAAMGDLDLVKSLIIKGADINNREEDFLKTPLHRASISGHKEVAQLLIAKGADVNAKNAWGYTPLHFAARSRKASKDIIELLIAKGADVNAKNNAGQTPLQLAKERRNKETIELLRKHGAKARTSQRSAASQSSK